MEERIRANRRRLTALCAVAAAYSAGYVLAIATLARVVYRATGEGRLVFFIVVGGVAALLAPAINVWAARRSFTGKTLAYLRDPRTRARLAGVVDGISLAAGIRRPAVLVVDDPAPNACALGTGPTARLFVTTGLLEKLDRAELEGVIAHELAHVRFRDTDVTSALSVMIGATSIFAMLLVPATFVLRERGADVRIRIVSVLIPVLLAILALPAFLFLLVGPLVSRLLARHMMHDLDFGADAEAVRLARNPEALLRALRKLQWDPTVMRAAALATDPVWFESPTRRPGPEEWRWLDRLFNTHPSLEQRIEALERMLPGVVAPVRLFHALER